MTAAAEKAYREWFDGATGHRSAGEAFMAGYEAGAAALGELEAALTAEQGLSAALVATAKRAEARVAELEAERDTLRDAAESAECFYPEALSLVRELVEDAERVYEPEKGWPPHIESAHHLGDHEETISLLRAALGVSVSGTETPPGFTTEPATKPCPQFAPHDRHEWINGVRREVCPGVRVAVPPGETP